MNIEILEYLLDYTVRVGFDDGGVCCSLVFNLSDLEFLRDLCDTVRVVFDEVRKESFDKMRKKSRSIKIKCACGYVNLIPSLEVFHVFESLKCEKCGRVIAYAER